jgi:hypothetical protein
VLLHEVSIVSNSGAIVPGSAFEQPTIPEVFKPLEFQRVIKHTILRDAAEY